MSEDELIEKIKCSQSALGSDLDKLSSRNREVEVRVDGINESSKGSDEVESY